MEFSTIDAEGNPVEEGKVFYRGRVMTRTRPSSSSGCDAACRRRIGSGDRAEQQPGRQLGGPQRGKGNGRCDEA
jgi:hypothetical protein